MKRFWLSLLIVVTIFVGCATTQNVVYELVPVQFDNCSPYWIGWVLWTDYPKEYVMFDPSDFVGPQEHKEVWMPPGYYSFTVWDAERDIIEDYFEVAVEAGTHINLGCTTATSGPGPWVVMQ